MVCRENKLERICDPIRTTNTGGVGFDGVTLNGQKSKASFFRDARNQNGRPRKTGQKKPRSSGFNEQSSDNIMLFPQPDTSFRIEN